MSAVVEVLPTHAKTMRESAVHPLPETIMVVPPPKGKPRRAIYTVNIGGDPITVKKTPSGNTIVEGGYAPEISALTFPYLIMWAKKIGASLEIINQRVFENPWPVTTEKFQSGMLARANKNEWTYCVDGDTLVHPDCFDFTRHVSKDTVLHNGKDLATIRWEEDEYFLRDGRHIGSCTWNTAASDWCLDIWQPLELTYDEAVSRIHITLGERNCGINPAEHLIDDYTHSRNIAKYGLKFTTYTEICQKNGMSGNPYLFHLYTHPNETKFARMCATLVAWGAMSQTDAADLARRWGIQWDGCDGGTKGMHNGPQACPQCGGSGVTNARRKK